jgi:hypothetical protein
LNITPEAALQLIKSLEFSHAPKAPLFITGSLVYGVTKGSTPGDVDFVCHLKDFEFIKHGWSEVPHPTYTCKSFKKEVLPGILANAIVAHSQGEYDAWAIATRALAAQGRRDWPTKRDRVEAFAWVLRAALGVLCK